MVLRLSWWFHLTFCEEVVGTKENMERQEEFPTELRRSLELFDEHKITPVASAAVATPRVWTPPQLLRLLRAWRDVLDEQESEAEQNEEAVTESLTHRIYERVIVLCVDEEAYEEAYEEAFSGTQSEVPEMQNALVATYAFIARFNTSCGKVNVRVGGKVVARRSMNWFAVSERKQRRIVERQYSGTRRFLFCVDEAMYEVIGSILGVEDDEEEAQLDAILVDSESSVPPPLDHDAVARQSVASPRFELLSVKTTEDVSSLTEQELHPELAAIEASLPPHIWRRDEIFQLIRAWGAALTDMSDAEVPSKATTEFKNNVFEHYCSEVEGGEEATRRTAVSSWTKIQSLARSFQFITDFNHDKIHWMTSGVLIAKPNSWYELSESYQNWVVKKYFRAKNEHTAFSSLYNDMLAPIATNIRACPEWWPPRTHYPNAPPSKKKERNEEKQKTTSSAENEPVSRPEKPAKKKLSVKTATFYEPGKSGRKPNWVDDEVENLVYAWGEVMKESAAEKELLVDVFNARVYEKFLALSGGDSRRDLLQIPTEMSSLVQSCAFISAYDEKKIPFVPEKRSSRIKKWKPWFSLSETKRQEIVSARFRNTHTVRFTYVTEEMVPLIAEYSTHWATLTSREEPVAPMRKASGGSWSRDELALLLGAWVDVMTFRQPHEDDATLVGQIHTQFHVLCGGESTRQASAILVQKRELLSSYNRLRAYFQKHFESEDMRDQWFRKSESERRKLLRTEANQHAYNVDLDKEMFELMEKIVQADRQLKLTPTVQGRSETAPTKNKPSAVRTSRVAKLAAKTKLAESSSEKSGDGDNSDFKIPTPGSINSTPRAATSSLKSIIIRKTLKSPKSVAVAGPRCIDAGITTSTRKRVIEDPLVAQKKQKLDQHPALRLPLYSEQQAQIKLLKSMLDQVREERELERNERRRERDERQQEHEETRRELEEWRQERLVERESYRVLLRELREVVKPGAKDN